MSLNHRNITSYNVEVILNVRLSNIDSNGSVNMTISKYHRNIYFSVFTKFLRVSLKYSNCGPVLHWNATQFKWMHSVFLYVKL